MTVADSQEPSRVAPGLSSGRVCLIAAPALEKPSSSTMTSCGSSQGPMNHSGSITASGALCILAVGTISLGTVNEPRR